MSQFLAILNCTEFGTRELGFNQESHNGISLTFNVWV